MARTAKRTAKVFGREETILQDRTKAPMIHDFEASEMGE